MFRQTTKKQLFQIPKFSRQILQILLNSWLNKYKLQSMYKTIENFKKR